MILTLYPPRYEQENKNRIANYVVDDSWNYFEKDFNDPRVINTLFIGKLETQHGMENSVRGSISNIVEITFLDSSKITVVLDNEDYANIKSNAQ